MSSASARGRERSEEGREAVGAVNQGWIGGIEALDEGEGEGGTLPGSSWGERARARVVMMWPAVEAESLPVPGEPRRDVRAGFSAREEGCGVGFWGAGSSIVVSGSVGWGSVGEAAVAVG